MRDRLLIIVTSELPTLPNRGKKPTQKVTFKGAVSRDFRPLFFHESKPSEPLINRLKWFFLKIRFLEDIRI